MFNYGLWTAICVISESLWLGTLSGAGTVTMASSAGLATAMLWGRGPSTWIVAVSTLIAEVFVLRKPLSRALFNTSQITLTMGAACSAFILLGGPEDGLAALTSMPSGERAALLLLAPTL